MTHTLPFQSLAALARLSSLLQESIACKQGCPLNPTLFGLFLDGLHRYLQHHLPATGFLLGGTRVRDLQYADDVLLLDPPGGLQHLLNGADVYCKLVGMQISASKPAVIYFGPPPIPTPTFSCSGERLQLVDEYKYLIVRLSSSDGLAASLPMLLGKLSAAGALLTRQFEFSRPQNPSACVSRSATHTCHQQDCTAVNFGQRGHSRRWLLPAANGWSRLTWLPFGASCGCHRLCTRILY